MCHDIYKIYRLRFTIGRPDKMRAGVGGSSLIRGHGQGAMVKGVPFVKSKTMYYTER